MQTIVPHDPWFVRAGRWLTKRRGVILAPLFTIALFAARWDPHPWFEFGVNLAGFLCLVAAIWLRMVAASYHEASHQSAPITAGPYAWVRHPLYLANFLLGLGVVLIAGWWPMVIGYVLLFLLIHALIARAEEMHLTKLYGEQYEAYHRTVPAILPWRPYRGLRYGSRSQFKLKNGKEWRKVFGYFAGVVAILTVKRGREAIRLPVAYPLPVLYEAVAAVIVILGIIYRPKTRWAWVRGCQTATVVGCALMIALYLPGVLPTPRPVPAPAVSASSLSRTPVLIEPPSSEIEGKAALPTHESLEPDGWQRLPAPPAIKPRGFWSGLRSFLWNHLDVAGGIATFGIASLVEEEREEDKGSNFEIDRDVDEIGPIALGVAVALGVWKQWHRPSGFSSALPSDENPWRAHVQPVLSEDGVTVLAVFKRRF